jgi:hypothetical protein
MLKRIYFGTATVLMSLAMLCLGACSTSRYGLGTAMCDPIITATGKDMYSARAVCAGSKYTTLSAAKYVCTQSERALDVLSFQGDDMTFQCVKSKDSELTPR